MDCMHKFILFMSEKVCVYDVGHDIQMPCTHYSAIRLIHKFSRERQPLHCDAIVSKQ